MVYINGAYDSKVWEEINHFETARYGAILQGITKKRDTHTLSLIASFRFDK